MTITHDSDLNNKQKDMGHSYTINGDKIYPKKAIQELKRLQVEINQIDNWKDNHFLDPSDNIDEWAKKTNEKDINTARIAEIILNEL